MCTPYIDDLKCRVLSLIDSIRSTRLKCVEVKVAGSEEEQREPLVFSINQLTVQVNRLMQDIQKVGCEAALWNHKTPQDIIEQFQNASIDLSKEMIGVMEEATTLRKDVSGLGISGADLDLSDEEFQSLCRQVTEFANPPNSQELIKATSDALREFVENPQVRRSVASQIEGILSKIPQEADRA